MYEKYKKIRFKTPLCQSSAKLDPDDPAEAHFHLARLLKAEKKDKARRHLLMALEEAPRFRQAHQLLLNWKNEKE